MENKFTILRDSSEKKGFGWTFPKADRCLGTKIESLYTGDYTIEHLKDKLCIERKLSTAEFANNLFESRFADCLERMSKFEHAYLLLEFPFEYIISYPKYSGIPSYLWKSIQTRPDLFLKKFHELQLSYPRLRVCFVGTKGKEYCLSLFKRITDLYQ